MEEVIGHQNVLDFFAKVMKNGSLSHAYCFVGPEMVGKKTVAKHIASELLKVEPEKLTTATDFILVERLFDEKTEKTKKDINVEQIRELREVLARHAFLGGYQVAIIDEANRLNSEAANALLKTLEEPRPKTIIFLLTDDENKLPTTILSRCQKIYFSVVSKEKIFSALQKKTLEKNIAEELAVLSHGLPGQAITWLENPESLLEYKKEIERFLALFQKNFHEKNKLIEDLFKDKTDSVGNRDDLQKILSLWQLILRDGYLLQNDLSAYVVQQLKSLNLNNEELLAVSNKIDSAKELLNKNVHPRLLMEQILLNIP